MPQRSITPEMVKHVKNFLGVGGIQFFKQMKEEHGRYDAVFKNGPIPYAVHFNEGMQVRNALRNSGWCEDWSDHDFDDSWVIAVTYAVEGSSFSASDPTPQTIPKDKAVPMPDPVMIKAFPMPDPVMIKADTVGNDTRIEMEPINKTFRLDMLVGYVSREDIIPALRNMLNYLINNSVLPEERENPQECRVVYKTDEYDMNIEKVIFP